jgi:transketolase
MYFDEYGKNNMTPYADLAQMALEIRRDILTMIHAAGSGHPGGSLSATDILVTLYANHLRHRPQEPLWFDRDRFILSKGHAAPVLYAVLAKFGYFPHEELMTLRQFGSRLQGHPCRRKGLPGIETSGGSLGQGLSIAIGMAVVAQRENKPWNVYCLLGDGELDEGQIWEAAMAAAHYKLDNLVAIVDNNNLQIDGHVPDVMNIYPLDKKFEAFNWRVIEINGHDFKQIDEALRIATAHRGDPVVIIARTLKGKGVSFMENNVSWHGKAPNDTELELALKELE